MFNKKLKSELCSVKRKLKALQRKLKALESFFGLHYVDDEDGWDNGYYVGDIPLPYDWMEGVAELLKKKK